MYENVGQFEVPMHDLMLIQSLEGIQNLYEKLHSLLLGQCLVLLEILREIPLIAVLKNEVKVIGSLLDIIQLYDVFIIASLQHLYLVL